MIALQHVKRSLLILPIILIGIIIFSLIAVNAQSNGNEIPPLKPDHEHHHTHTVDHTHNNTDCKIAQAHIDGAMLEANSMYRSAQYMWLLNHDSLTKPHEFYNFNRSDATIEDHKQAWTPLLKEVAAIMNIFENTGWNFYAPNYIIDSAKDCDIAKAIKTASQIKAQAQYESAAIVTMLGWEEGYPQEQYNEENKSAWVSYIKGSWYGIQHMQKYDYSYLPTPTPAPTIMPTPTPTQAPVLQDITERREKEHVN